MADKGLLVVLSAPSGCGKDTVFNELCKRRDDIVKSVSATTREKREGEVEGVNYYFKTEDEFKRLINSNGLLEFTVYNGCYYGTPVAGVNKAIEDGKICFLIIEVEGGQNIMRLRPDCVSIFLLPPSMEELRRRLEKRNTDDEESIKNRLEHAEFEIGFSHLYDYTIVNDDLDICVNKVEEIIENELNTNKTEIEKETHYV